MYILHIHRNSRTGLAHSHTQLMYLSPKYIITQRRQQLYRMNKHFAVQFPEHLIILTH